MSVNINNLLREEQIRRSREAMSRRATSHTMQMLLAEARRAVDAYLHPEKIEHFDGKQRVLPK